MDCQENCRLADKYRVNLSYPEINIQEPNEKAAKLLLNDYAGHVSEFGAIAQYIFHMITLEKEYPDVSDALRGIAIVEMDHLDRLGDLIKELGTLPEFKGCEHGKVTYWNATPKNVNYSTSVKKALLADISAEIKAIEQYEEHIKQIDDDRIISLLQRIILDEQIHIEILTSLYKKYTD
ncbi:MAG: ferritin-like domain-containing protein [Clostridiales bacterium]|nr:ferritin-like domain-containing protein [Clostridiales bacterium]